MTDEELRQTINEVREMKKMCGNINMKLTNIVTQRGQDFKKKLEAEYQRGLNDAWEAARKIVCDDELDWNTLLHIFNRGNFDGIFGDFSPSEAIDKLKSYKEKQKADNDKFEFGDEIIDSNGVKGCVISMNNEKSDTMYALFGGYRVPQCICQKNYRKTGKHYDVDDIKKLLEDMRHD